MLTNKKQVKHKSELKYYKTSNISISENNNFYEIDIDNKVFTTDFIEAISYIMRHSKEADEYFWKLPVKKPFNDSYIHVSTIYWLSGGDNFWQNPVYNLEWSDYVDLYQEEFSNKIKVCFKLTNFLEVKNYIKKNLN